MHSNLYPELQARIIARRNAAPILTDAYFTRLAIIFTVAFVAGAILAGVFGINIFSDLPTNLG